MNNYILFDTVREALNAAYDYTKTHSEIKTGRISMRSENRIDDYIFILNTKEHLMGRKGKFFRYDFTTHEPVEMIGAPYYVINDIGERIVSEHPIKSIINTKKPKMEGYKADVVVVDEFVNGD